MKLLSQTAPTRPWSWVIAIFLWPLGHAEANAVSEQSLNANAQHLVANTETRNPEQRTRLRELVASFENKGAEGSAGRPLTFVRNGFAGIVNDRIGLLFDVHDDGSSLIAIYGVRDDRQFLGPATHSQAFWKR